MKISVGLWEYNWLWYNDTSYHLELLPNLEEDTGIGRWPFD